MQLDSGGIDKITAPWKWHLRHFRVHVMELCWKSYRNCTLLKRYCTSSTLSLMKHNRCLKMYGYIYVYAPIYNTANTYVCHVMRTGTCHCLSPVLRLDFSVLTPLTHSHWLRHQHLPVYRFRHFTLESVISHSCSLVLAKYQTMGYIGQAAANVKIRGLKN